MSRAAYFNATNKGEIGELKSALASNKEAVKKDAVKRVIAAMSVGKDVSMLFSDVVKNIHTQSLELKKLVYLYVMNYSKTQPELAILAVNTFVQDCESPNPLVRALAIRSMGCIRVEKISEYLCDPLRNALKDKDPYVRKTAAICVAKLADINLDLVEDQGMIDTLNDLLTDGNPMVVANAVAALNEIQEYAAHEVFVINSRVLSKLLPALNDCSEWGQAIILNALGDYEPVDSEEAEMACERVTSRLNHANSSVVLGACKVILNYYDFIDSRERRHAFLKKLSPPLITLVSRRPEIQYVALRNINLIVQKRPEILENDIRVFFCKYSDEVFCKLEKLEIMVMLVNEDTIGSVLQELKEYATEVDVTFVRRAVRAIGRCAIKLESHAKQCIKVLLELIQTKVNYVVQTSVVVLKDCFRRYPNRYEGIIATLCENLDSLDETEAKAAMIWIIGEYNSRIENSDELLDQFLDTFLDEPAQVQLQLLTAIVKLFLNRPGDTQDMVQKVLNYATKETENPDLRDRGFVYWRLLAADPAAAKAVVQSEKPLISDDSAHLERGLLQELLQHIGSLASVYHKPPSTFVTKLQGLQSRTYRPPRDDEYSDEGDDADEGPSSAQQQREGDLMGLGDLMGTAAAAAPGPAHQPPQQQQPSLLGDLSFLTAPSAPAVPPKRVLLTAAQGKGIQLSGRWSRINGAPALEVTLENQTQAPVTGFALQFNRNYFGIAPAGNALAGVPTLAPGGAHEVVVPVQYTPTRSEAPGALQVALKAGAEVLYFADNVPMHVFLSEGGTLEGNAFLESWTHIPDQNERLTEVAGIQTSPEAIKSNLAAGRIFFVAQRQVDVQEVLYFSSKTDWGTLVLAEITFQIGTPLIVCVRSQDLAITALFSAAVAQLLR